MVTKILHRAAAAMALVVSLMLIPGWQATAIAQGSAATEPPLSATSSQLAASLICHGNPKEGPEPVLLVPGTTLNADVNYDWNYEPAFSSMGRSWCAVTVPAEGMGDIQVAAEYIVNGIRTLHATAGRKIAILGYSQGGMSPRWALKYWPDTRADVDKLISLDASNHGTLDAVGLCVLACAPSIWQQRTGSNFLSALNAGAETYPGISYTQIYTLEDEVVFPNLGPDASSPLHTGGGAIANIAVQTICPLDVADHLTMGSIDAVGYALVVDALDHAGPASASRIPSSVCGHLTMPSVNISTLLANEARFDSQVITSLVTSQQTTQEPALASYAR